MVRARGSLSASALSGSAHPQTLSHEEILRITGAQFVGPRPPRSFTGCRSDDRTREGDLFVAIRGARHDTHSRIPDLPGRHPEAPGWGVRGIVGECDFASPPALPYYRVESSRRALALLEQRFAGDPGRDLRTLGVTGTNGKSTTVRLLSAILEAAGRDVGWSGTVTARLGTTERSSSVTTPEPRELARGMAALRDAGGQDLVLEVSSHALTQHRVAGIELAGAVFTNLGRDHLDYHRSEREYLEAKLAIFALLAAGAPAVLPARGPVPGGHDSLRGKRVLTFAETGPADAFAREVRFGASGMELQLSLLGEDFRAVTPLVGRHNLRNVLAAALLARSLDVPLEVVAEGLAAAPPVAGRLEPVGADRDRRVFVDYAHTPDALEAVLGAVREFTERRLLVVFGCGGDRDRGKRPQMGRVATDLADRVFVTSDNPRSEDPDLIIEDVLGGIGRQRDVVTESDRGTAIERAVGELGRGDVLVVAGKGHERDQLIRGTSLPFDDRLVISSVLDRGAHR